LRKKSKLYSFEYLSCEAAPGDGNVSRSAGIVADRALNVGNKLATKKTTIPGTFRYMSWFRLRRRSKFGKNVLPNLGEWPDLV
jgi:hypothetical protein